MASLKSKTKEELIEIIQSMETLLRKLESKEEPTLKDSNLTWEQIEEVLNTIDEKPKNGKTESDATTEEKKEESKLKSEGTTEKTVDNTHTHTRLSFVIFILVCSLRSACVCCH